MSLATHSAQPLTPSQCAVTRRMRRLCTRPKLVSKKWTSGIWISRMVRASSFMRRIRGSPFSAISAGVLGGLCDLRFCFCQNQVKILIRRDRGEEPRSSQRKPRETLIKHSCFPVPSVVYSLCRPLNRSFPRKPLAPFPASSPPATVLPTPPYSLLAGCGQTLVTAPPSIESAAGTCDSSSSAPTRNRARGSARCSPAQRTDRQLRLPGDLSGSAESAALPRRRCHALADAAQARENP